MLRRTARAVLLLSMVPVIAFAAEDPLRALAQRVGGTVYPEEPGQPVTQLFLSGTPATDADLAALAGRSDLQVLFARDTAITDAGLAHLTGVTGLYQLDLSATQVTDAGLVHLAGMRNLAGLQLGGTRVTDDGLAALRGLTALRHLGLTETAVSAAGASGIAAALPTARVECDAGQFEGAGVAAEVAAAQAAMADVAAAQAAIRQAQARQAVAAPPCTDLRDPACLKAEMRSGDHTRCVAATNGIAEVRNERAVEGLEGVDQPLVEAMAPFLYELARSDGDPCQSSGRTGLDWLGPGIREVLPVDEVAAWLLDDLEAAIAAGRLRSDQSSALRILAALGPGAAPAVPLLRRIVAAPGDPVTRIARPLAAAALAAIGPAAHAAEDELLAVMAETAAEDYADIEVRTLAPEALLAIGADPARVAAALVPWVGAFDDERDLWITARRLLVEIGEPGALALAAALPGADSATFGAGIDVLNSMGPAARAAVPQLVSLVVATGDPDGSLEMVLRETGPASEADVAAIAGMLDTDDEQMQGRAISILGDWGPAARAALPALRRLATSDASTSFMAQMAVEEIEGGGT